MKKTILPLLLLTVFFAACNNGSQKTAVETTDSTSTALTVDPAKAWKFGIALWTFHTFNFPESLVKVDSAGVVYIEPNTFHKYGPELKDTLVGQLSFAGVDKLKALIASKGLKMESIYINGDSTILSWKKQFDIAKQFGVQFVTTEPPLNMWDSIDSLAGAYGVKVAIKGHPNFGACADLGHWPKSGINPLDGIKKLSGHIIGIHLKDIAAFNDPKLRDVPVGTGVVDFPAIFAELKKQNFKGHIYIERDAEDLPSNLSSVINTVKYYNDQIAKLK